ncbi:hypothetical protein G6514_004291 [Epicoccum nigrum]|nr:hypothetical protein G6514_004291 [Epicoccum nigrum]
MPPKALTTTRRVRAGRATVTEPVAPVAVMAPASPSKKRGRPSKVNGTVESAKKRGRPAKVQANESIAQIDKAIKRGRRSVAAAEEVVAEASVPTKKRAGRPAKVTETVAAAAAAAAAEVAAPKKRTGRPPKDAAPATPKRGRGRPALDLNKVTGPARVAKRTSPRSKPVAEAPTKVAAAPRVNPKMRSRLRDRTVPAAKPTKEVAQPLKKARGRPKKIEAKTEAQAPAPKKTVGRGRGRKAVAPAPAAAVKKVTARPKAAAPRKRRGYTALEIPDRFAAQVRQYLVELQAEDAANAAAAAGEADDEGDEGDEVNVDAVIDLGPQEDIAGPSNGVVTDLDDEEAAGELTEEEKVEEDGHMLIDAADGADDAQLDEEDDLVGEEDNAEAPRSNIDDDSELPSETAVLAEIAAVQGNDDMDVDTRVVVQQTELQRRPSSSNISVDLERDITEVTSRPQIDGTADVDSFNTHVHQHKHVHEPAHVPEAALATNVGTLFGGF